MDPLSVTANIVTVLQVANSILSICYEYRAAIKEAPWSLTRIVEEIKDLRNVLERLEQVTDRVDALRCQEVEKFRPFQLLCEPETGPVAQCHHELCDLEKKISYPSEAAKPSKRRVFIQVMGWQLREKDAKAHIERIERCKKTILLAITADEA
jgi:hypothetical protein